MDKPTNSGDRKVAHFIVQPAAYHAVIQTLGDLPYKVVAGCLQAFTEGSRAVFEQPPDTGKIVDETPPPHDWHLDELSGNWQCDRCSAQIADDSETVPDPGECPGPPEPVDNDDEEGE